MKEIIKEFLLDNFGYEEDDLIEELADLLGYYVDEEKDNSYADGYAACSDYLDGDGSTYKEGYSDGYDDGLSVGFDNGYDAAIEDIEEDKSEEEIQEETQEEEN